MTSAFSDEDLQKKRCSAPQTVLKDGPPPEFQRLLADGHLELPITTEELIFEVRENLYKERLIVVTNLTNPLIGFLFLQRKSILLDIRQCVLHFPFLSVQPKDRDSTYDNISEIS